MRKATWLPLVSIHLTETAQGVWVRVDSYTCISISISITRRKEHEA